MGVDSYLRFKAVGPPSLVICSTRRRALARSVIMFYVVADGAAS